MKLANKNDLTQRRLKDVLHYEPDAGVFVWLVVTSNRVRVGEMAGTPGADGYLRIAVDGGRYLAHRLAWFYMTGEWPAETVDHRNTIRQDIRWSNLREASRVVNMQNMRRARKDNSTGVLGVRKMRAKFQANIRVNGKSINCGTYATKERAYEAYIEAKRRLHPGCTL